MTSHNSGRTSRVPSVLLWAGLLCLSFVWLFALNIYTTENDVWWVVLLVAGCLCNTAALRRKTLFKNTDYACCFLFVPLVVSIFILPFPYNLGVILVSAGLVLALLCRGLSILSAPAAGLILSGVTLIIQSPLGYLYTLCTSYSRNIFWLDGVLNRLFAFFHLRVSYSQHLFYIQTIKDLYAFPTTWDRLGWFPLLAFWAGSLPIIYLFSQRKNRDMLKLFACGAAYSIARYVFMVLLFLYLMTFVPYKEEVNRVDIFWDARVMLLSFLPFIWLLCRMVPLKLQEAACVHEAVPFSSAVRKSLVYGSLALFFLGAAYGFQDPGKEKAGRVLLDEKHSGWEKSTRKMDTEWYGNESGYNFYWMAEFINHHFPLQRNFDEITPELLSGFDILILKNATAPFSPAEVDAVRNFVLNGGGLYILSEHTNVFGNSTYLNPVAKEFGFCFRYDVLFDIERKFEQLYYPPRLNPHPVVQHLPYFCFKVSCSIQPLSLRCEPVILSTGIKSQDIYYPSGNFYPPVKDESQMPFGAFLQMAGIKAGKGRVLGFTDSTTYSNFEAFIAGKPELLLSSLAWLNRENRWNGLNYLFLALAVLCCALALRNGTKERREGSFYLWLAVLAVFSLSCALLACQSLSRRANPLPQPKTPYMKVVFEQEHGDYELPLQGFTKEMQKSFEVFYLWVLRIGYYPFTGRTLQADLSDAGILVIINPRKQFDTEENSRIKEYLEKGGKLLVMDTPDNGGSTADELLASFGMKINREKSATVPSLYAPSGMGTAPPNRASVIEGGEPLLRSAEGDPILSMVKVGNGSVAALTFSRLFTNPPMGGSYRVVPNQQQRAIYELEFNLLKGLGEGNLEKYFEGTGLRGQGAG
jgi:hypothetical protein